MSKKSKVSKTTPSPEGSPEEFVFLALRTLKHKPDARGVHTVYSGFNAAFRDTFPGLDPVEFVNKMAKEGQIKTHLARGGAMIYPADTDLSNRVDASKALKKMGLKK